MFYLYHHNDLRRLAELLAVLRRHHADAHPLEPDHILVPNRGIARWLQMDIATSEGVAANMDFLLPARFLWRLMQQSLADRPDTDAWSMEHMRWHLHALLPELETRLPQIGAYLRGGQRGLHRFQLAEQLAAVFDEYLVYRRDMLIAWERGRGEQRPPANWQADVWRALVNRLGKRHRARVMDDFLQACSDGEIDTSALPHRLFCFGLGNLPPDYLRALYAIGQRVDVHFLLHNLSSAYWGDLAAQRVSLTLPLDTARVETGIAPETGHPLLASLGRSARDFVRLLYSDELTAIQEPELGELMAYTAPQADTLLAAVQRDIVNLAPPTPRDLPTESDNSIQIHACHGVLREVQVLQDQLLDLLARDTTLQPRDIVVMLPDLRRYSPAIRSVFGSGDRQRRLPWSLSDQPRVGSHPIVRTFAELLDLPLSRWTANQIMDIAAVPAVMRRVGLDTSDLAVLRDWVQAAGVRWGLDASTRKRLDAGDDSRYTWTFGLDRLLLGLALTNEESVIDEVAPWTDLEGGGTAALGRLWYVVRALADWQTVLDEPASAADWHDRINRFLDSILRADPDDPAEDAAMTTVQDALRSLEPAADALGDEPLDWETVRELLVGALQAPGERQPFLSGGITFCGMIPLRTVPFRVVCLLGMNDGDFPRQTQDRAFNIIRSFPRLGDRNMRDDDRLLFLQCLLAAEDTVYISFIGQDVRSGDTLEPSPIVGEFLDCLADGYFAEHTARSVGDRLVTRQPMQPFSRRYFDADSPARVFTFGDHWQPATRASGLARTPHAGWADHGQLPDGHPAELQLGEIRRFLRHPARHFFQQRLQLRLDTDKQRLDDDDPLQLDALGRALLRRDLLTMGQHQDEAIPIDTPPPHLRYGASLPPPPLDHPAYAREAALVNQLLPLWRGWLNEPGADASRDVALTLDNGILLAGRVNGVWPDSLRRLHTGTPRLRHVIGPWLDLLASAASGGPCALQLAGLDQDQPVSWRFAVTPQSAAGALATLLDVYREGNTRPLLFHPDLADTYLGGMAGTCPPADPDKTLGKLNERLTADAYQPHHLADDPYLRPLLLRDRGLGDTTEQSDFHRLSLLLCQPLLDALDPGEVLE